MKKRPEEPPWNYVTWYMSKPWIWRVTNGFRWWAESVWCAICFRPGPGERWLMTSVIRRVEAMQAREEK